MMKLPYNQKIELDRKIQEHMFFLDIPGLVAGVWFEGEMAYKEAFGMADLEKKRSMKTDDIFHMASISKLFTATAIMQLHEKMNLHIDDKLLDYLPGFCPATPTFDRVTIRQMLSHTSGLPDCDDYEWEKARFDEEALGDYVMAQKHLSFVHQPGERFLYSNIAYEMLGYVIQKISGLNFENYCQKNIFTPAQMKHSDFLKSNVSDEKLVKPHIKDDNNRVIRSRIFPYNRSHAPSSTLYAPMEDLFVFSKAVLETLSGKRDDILKQRSLQKMLQEETTIKKNESIGLGWFLSDYQEQRFIGHEGNDIGFRTTYAIVPSQKISIVVLANIQKASTRKIMRMLYDFFR